MGPTVALNLPEEFEVELELEPYGEKIELEFELVWPNSNSEPSSDRPRTSVAAPQPLR